ncbi:Secreted effector protein PipB2 [Pandoraea terrae]|uniref:Secreted effector protein PipB2 n=1 Tax=Pandoraea terrae TaxID=1537710 RepID=A0A5E4UBC5_9BURK|nr:pentapeptide repeat-containing protein [Pandoraea terrae]VVD97357.1 Secreted effector protein PipB2 [Pandoraea terrae]
MRSIVCCLGKPSDPTPRTVSGTAGMDGHGVPPPACLQALTEWLSPSERAWLADTADWTAYALARFDGPPHGLIGHMVDAVRNTCRRETRANVHATWLPLDTAALQREFTRRFRHLNDYADLAACAAALVDVCRPHGTPVPQRRAGMSTMSEPWNSDGASVCHGDAFDDLIRRCDTTPFSDWPAPTKSLALRLTRMTGGCAAGASLRDTALDGLRAAGANFHRTDLRGATFVKAALRKACFTDARASNASFAHADLSLADFCGADLAGAAFRGARIDRTQFRDAQMSQADLGGADGQNADFHRARLVGAGLRRTDLRGQAFEGNDMTRADLTQAVCARTHWRGVQLTAASLVGADFSHATFRDCIFDRANLTGANFDGAIFRDVRFHDAILVGASLRDVRFAGLADFDGATCSDMTLSFHRKVASGDFDVAVNDWAMSVATLPPQNVAMRTDAFCELLRTAGATPARAVPGDGMLEWCSLPLSLREAAWFRRLLLTDAACGGLAGVNLVAARDVFASEIERLSSVWQSGQEAAWALGPVLQHALSLTFREPTWALAQSSALCQLMFLAARCEAPWIRSAGRALRHQYRQALPENLRHAMTASSLDSAGGPLSERYVIFAPGGREALAVDGRLLHLAAYGWVPPGGDGRLLWYAVHCFAMDVVAPEAMPRRAHGTQRSCVAGAGSARTLDDRPTPLGDIGLALAPFPLLRSATPPPHTLEALRHLLRRWFSADDAAPLVAALERPDAAAVCPDSIEARWNAALNALVKPGAPRFLPALETFARDSIGDCFSAWLSAAPPARGQQIRALMLGLCVTFIRFASADLFGDRACAPALRRQALALLEGTRRWRSDAAATLPDTDWRTTLHDTNADGASMSRLALAMQCALDDSADPYWPAARELTIPAWWRVPDRAQGARSDIAPTSAVQGAEHCGVTHCATTHDRDLFWDSSESSCAMRGSGGPGGAVGLA